MLPGDLVLVDDHFLALIVDVSKKSVKIQPLSQPCFPKLNPYWLTKGQVKIRKIKQEFYYDY